MTSAPLTRSGVDHADAARRSRAVGWWFFAEGRLRRELPAVQRDRQGAGQAGELRQAGQELAHLGMRGHLRVAAAGEAPVSSEVSVTPDDCRGGILTCGGASGDGGGFTDVI